MLMHAHKEWPYKHFHIHQSFHEHMLVGNTKYNAGRKRQLDHAILDCMYPNQHQQSKPHSILADLPWTAKLQVTMSSKEATFAALTAEFELDEKIKALFLKGPMENLQDFCFYFTEEKEIDAFVAWTVL